MASNASVKKNIRIVRNRLGLSQEQMGVKLGMSRTSYRKLESGETTLIHSGVFKIAELASISPEVLLTEDLSVPDGEAVLCASDNADEKLRTLREDYEARLAAKDEKIAELGRSLADKSALIDSQKSIIALLEKHTTL